MVQFAVTGEYDLVVWGVNGTSLGEDLEFVELRRGGGGKIAPAGGSGGSLTFGGFGGEQTAGYLVVRALTPGSHYLRMEFGDGVAYADNYASMVDMVSPGGDAVYGEKDAVRIDLVFSGPVTVDLSGMSQGATDAAGNTFDALDHPASVATAVIGGSTYAVVASSGSAGVQIIDITDPANPTAAASIHDDQPGRPSPFDTLAAPEGIATITIDGRVYALVTSQINHGVQVVEITDPASPAAVASLTWDWAFPSSVEVARIGAGYYALVATSAKSQFAVFEITVPHDPSRTALVDRTGHDASFGYVDSVATISISDGVYALLADRTNGRIHLLDVSDPSVPESPLLPCIVLDVSVDGHRFVAGEHDPADTYPVRHAIYEQGSGTAKMSFIYTPRPGDMSEDLGYARYDSLVMNGNRLLGPSGQEIVPLLPEPGGSNSLRSNHQIVIDTLPPAAVSTEYSTGIGVLGIVFSEPLNGTVQAGLLHVRDGDHLNGTAVNLGNATIQSAAGDTVTLKVPSSQRPAIVGMAAPQLEIGEGAVWDRAANPVIAEPALSLTVRDRTAPTIALNGTNPVTLQVGETYTDEGAACTDDVDDAPQVIVDNPVDTAAVGEYTVTYTCSDSSDNHAAPLTRTVTVRDRTAPAITGSFGSFQGSFTASSTTPPRDTGTTQDNQEDRSNWHNATVTVHGSSHITVEQGFHADAGAACTVDGRSSWEAHLTFTGSRKAHLNVFGNQIKYYYAALGGTPSPTRAATATTAPRQDGDGRGCAPGV